MHEFGIVNNLFFVIFLLLLNLVIFGALQWAPCVRTSSYSFIPINLELCRPFVMVCRCECDFGLCRQFNFYHFLQLLNFVISVRLSIKLCIRSGMARARILNFYIYHQHEK